MNTIFYEVWHKPTDGPLTVLERGPQNQFGFTTKEAGIDWAKNRKQTYPHMDFWVRETESGWSSSSKKSKIIFKTEE